MRGVSHFSTICKLIFKICVQKFSVTGSITLNVWQIDESDGPLGVLAGTLVSTVSGWCQSPICSSGLTDTAHVQTVTCELWTDNILLTVNNIYHGVLDIKLYFKLFKCASEQHIFKGVLNNYIRKTLMERAKIEFLKRRMKQNDPVVPCRVSGLMRSVGDGNSFSE